MILYRVAVIFQVILLLAATNGVAQQQNNNLRAHEGTLLTEHSNVLNEQEEVMEGPAPPRRVNACWKDGEPRGRGHLPDRDTRECPNNQEMSMGLCYPRCGDKRIGFGPLCLDDCKATVYQCSSGLFCCETDELCSDLMQDVLSKLPKALFQLAIDMAKNPNDVRKIIQDFRAILAASLRLRIPLCSKLNEFVEPITNNNNQEENSKEMEESRSIIEPVILATD